MFEYFSSLLVQGVHHFY